MPLLRIKKRINIPLVVDIHFDFKQPQNNEGGADKIRNPGNTGAAKSRSCCESGKRKGIPIRIGVNAGSLLKNALLRNTAPNS